MKNIDEHSLYQTTKDLKNVVEMLKQTTDKLVVDIESGKIKDGGDILFDAIFTLQINIEDGLLEFKDEVSNFYSNKYLKDFKTSW